MTVGHIACSAQEILLAADGLQILLLIHFQVQIRVQIQAPIQVQVLIQVQTRFQVLMMTKSLLCSPSNTQTIESYSLPNYSAISTICTVISDEGSFTQYVFLS